MIYERELSDSIVNRYTNILGSFRSQTLNQSLVEFLSNFGNLYFGNLKQSVFEHHYQIRKKANLEKLLNCQQLTSPDLIQSVKFSLHLMRRAQTESWNLPGLLTEMTSDLHFGCGNTRLFVSGLCFPQPWKTMNFLILQKHSTPRDQYLENPVLIQNESDLHQVLNIPTELSDLPLAQLWFSIVPDNQQARVILELIQDRDTDDHQTAGQEYFDSFVAWQQSNPGKPKLKIYTNWPDNIIASKHWDIEIAGPSVLTRDKLLGYGQLELFLYHKNSDDKLENAHSLFVLSDRRIDTEDLFFWMDNKHSAFVEKNLDFVVFKSQPQYLTTRITVSDLN